MVIYIETIELLQRENVRNEFGGIDVITTRRKIFAQKKSVGMKETYEAAAHGFKPSLVFTLADYLDYSDEEFLEYEGREYRIIRTYQKPESKELELVCEHIVNNAEVYGGGNP